MFKIIHSTEQNIEYMRLEPNDQIKHIVFMIHGYGGTAHSMIEVAYMFNLPNTVYVLPNGLTQTPDNPLGRCWFHLEFEDGEVHMPKSSDIFLPKHIQQELQQSERQIAKFIQTIIDYYALLTKDTTIFGFSQGGILALSHGLYRQNTYAAVIAHSAMFFGNDYHINKNQNILLLHGKNDTTIPLIYMAYTKNYLDNAHIPYSEFIDNNLGHHVSSKTIAKACEFIDLPLS